MPNPEPKCPANYFGKGVNYQLTDDVDEVTEFERLWREWEAANPNDPTGDIALKTWQDYGVAETTPTVAHVTTESMARGSGILTGGKEFEEDQITLKLSLAVSEVDMLKRYSSFKRRRPRDIIATLIRQHCVIR